MGWYLLRKPYPGFEGELKVDITQDEVLLGRGRDCTVLCLSMYVSRHHCRVKTTDDGGLYLIDLGSSNGTFINANKVIPQEQQELSVGDEIGMGNVESQDKNCFVFTVLNDIVDEIQSIDQKERRVIEPVLSESSGKRQELVNPCDKNARKRFNFNENDPFEELVILSDSEAEEVGVSSSKKPKPCNVNDVKIEEKNKPTSEKIEDNYKQTYSVKTEDKYKPTSSVKTEDKYKPTSSVKIEDKPKLTLPVQLQSVEIEDRHKPSSRRVEDKRKSTSARIEDEHKPTSSARIQAKHNPTSSARVESKHKPTSARMEDTNKRTSSELEAKILTNDLPLSFKSSTPSRPADTKPPSSCQSSLFVPKPSPSLQAEHNPQPTFLNGICPSSGSPSYLRSLSLSLDEQAKAKQIEEDHALAQQLAAEDACEAQSKPTNRRLSCLRGDHSSTPSRQADTKPVTSTPCQGTLSSYNSPETWSPISKRLSVDEQLETKTKQVAEDRAMASVCEQSTVRQGLASTSSSLVNFSVDEECIEISGDEEDFPASQMFSHADEDADVKPDLYQEEQIPKEAGVDDIPSPSKSPEQDVEEIILIDDDDEDDDLIVTSRWLERLSQSQSSVKQEPVEEAVNEGNERDSDEPSEQNNGSLKWFYKERGEQVALANDKIKRESFKEELFVGRRVSEDRSSTSSMCKVESDQDKGMHSNDSFAQVIEESSDDIEFMLKSDTEEDMFVVKKKDTKDSVSLKKSSKLEKVKSHRKDRESVESKKDKKERRDKGKEHRKKRRKEEDRDHSEKRDKHHRSRSREQEKEEQRRDRSKADRSKKQENGWRSKLKSIADSSSDEERGPRRPTTSMVPCITLTRVEEDRSLQGRFQLLPRQSEPEPEPEPVPQSEDGDGSAEDEADAFVETSRDSRKSGAKRIIALTEALPMPPRRAHNRGISGPEATRMFEELRHQDSRRHTSTTVNRKDLRKQKLAEMALRTSKDKDKQEPKRAAAGAPAKIKVTDSNRGSFLTQAEEAASSSRPRSRTDVVRRMNRIPKLDRAVSASPAAVPAKSPLQFMEKGIQSPIGKLTEAPFLPPLEIPTGPQPKRRVAQRPPPGYNDVAHGPGAANETVACARSKSPAPRPTSSKPPLTNGMQVKSILSSSSKHNITANKKKCVKFKDDLVEIKWIESLPNTKPVSSSRDAGLPPKIPVAVVLPNSSFVKVDEAAINDVVYDVSKWNPKWLLEEKNVLPDTVPPVVPNMNLPTMPRTEFVDFREYLSTMYPLLMIELWAGVSKEYNIRESNLRNRNNEDTSKFMAVDLVTSTQVLQRPDKMLTALHCHMLIDEQCGEDKCPRQGNLVILDLPLHQASGPAVILPVFGYVFFERRERIDPRVQCHKDLLKKCPRPSQKLTFHVYVRERNNSAIVLDKPMRIMNVKYIRSDLRVFQAMKHLAHLPLQYSIISPRAANEDFSLPDISNKKFAYKELLNPTQEKIVLQTAEVCLQDKPKICLIQGPPGTGKSHIITSLVMQLLYRDRLYSKANRERGRIPRILLCAPSNNAVDVLVRRLLSRRQLLEQQHRFKMVRVGQPNFMNPDIKCISLQELAKQDVMKQNQDVNDPVSIQMDISNWKAKLQSVENSIRENSLNNKPVSQHLMTRSADLTRGLRVLEERLKNAQQNGHHVQSNRNFAIHKESSKKILRGADIVATTLSSCLIKVMETVFQASADKYQFSVCIVDEATQCLEAETLIPLLLGVKTLVLVGDPRQLPATIMSKVAREKGLGTSLFARLQKCIPGAVQMLDVQYRMHPEIIRWPNKFFYNRALKTPDNFQNERESKVMPYAILSLSSQQDPRNGETNDQEARLVMRLAELIVEQRVVEINQFKLGIVTPYQSQRKMLQHLLERMDPKFSCAIEINTIDSFQGKEKDVIIMSCVRTNGIGFLGDQQRLNVALTRAKYSLFICGNFDSLSREPMWGNLLYDARQRRCFLTVPVTVSKDELWNLISRKNIS